MVASTYGVRLSAMKGSKAECRRLSADGGEYIWSKAECNERE